MRGNKQNGQQGRNPADRHSQGNHHRSNYTTTHGAPDRLRDLAAEKAALGAVVLNKIKLADVRQWLQVADFGYIPHQHIYISMLQRDDKGEPYDEPFLLLGDLKQANTGLSPADAANLVNTLGNYCQEPENVGAYCQMVLQHALKAAWYDLAQISAGITNPDPDEAEIAAESAKAQERIADIKRRLAGITTGASASTSLADVEEEEIDWLWYGRLARRKISLLDGDPGVGKGLTITEIIACLTTGRPLPGDTARRSPQDILLLSPEDGIGDTIKPRLRVAGADMSRVHVLSTYRDAHGIERDVTFPSAAPIIEAEARRVNACLLVIDPIMACLDGGVKTSDDTQVRAALRPLAHACEATNIAVLLVRHMNKSGDGKALYRGGGSIAFTGLARILMLMTEHPDDAGGGDKRVALAVSKINLVKTPPTLGLTIRPSDNPDMPPRVLWDEEPLHFTADELLSASNTKQSQERRDVVRAIADAQHPLTVVEIAQATGVDTTDPLAMNTLRQRLMRIEKAGQIVRVDRGVYSLPSLSNHNNHNNNNKHNNRNKPNITDITFVRDVSDNADVTNHHMHDFTGPYLRPNGPRQCRHCQEYGLSAQPAGMGAS